MKDPTQKAHFYRSTLKDALPFIPRVSTVFLLSASCKIETLALSTILFFEFLKDFLSCACFKQGGFI